MQKKWEMTVKNEPESREIYGFYIFLFSELFSNFLTAILILEFSRIFSETIAIFSRFFSFFWKILEFSENFENFRKRKTR